MVSETRYKRNARSTVNGLLSYELKTTQTNSRKQSEELRSYGFLGIRVWKRTSGGSETEITSGTPVAQVVIPSTVGTHTKSNTWSCPQTVLNITDSIVVRLYKKSGLTWSQLLSSTGENVTFQTEQLGNTQLDSATWTVYYIITCARIFRVWYKYYEFGHATTANSRITNFSHSTPVAVKAGLNIPEVLPLIIG